MGPPEVGRPTVVAAERGGEDGRPLKAATVAGISSTSSSLELKTLAVSCLVSRSALMRRAPKGLRLEDPAAIAEVR